MRTLTDHIVVGDSSNHQLGIDVLDEPGQGGANHLYRVSLPAAQVTRAEEAGVQVNPSHYLSLVINFQNGPIKEFGVNGITQEVLLAIVIDRLRGFQAGPYACAANAEALSQCETALYHLQTRTRERIARGVEGTHEK